MATFNTHRSLVVIECHSSLNSRHHTVYYVVHVKGQTISVYRCERRKSIEGVRLERAEQKTQFTAYKNREGVLMHVWLYKDARVTVSLQMALCIII